MSPSSSSFAYELAALVQAQTRAHPGHPEGVYALPWYLVLGAPSSGRSTAVKAMNLGWPHGDHPVAMPTPEPRASYWLAEKAVFIEPGPTVVGPQRQPSSLQELAAEIAAKRTREPIDGIILVLSVARMADETEAGVDDYVKAVRRQIVEVGQQLGAEVPVYVVVTMLDTLWGFGDVFHWTAARRDEEPWGFALPPGAPDGQTPARIDAELEALTARLESYCFDKLSNEDPAPGRVRAFQHLLETRDLMSRLRRAISLLAAGSAFESAPWIRALALGSGLPGTGQTLRHGRAKLGQMGLHPPAASGTPTPGGMPLHAFLEAVLLPERDLVPTRRRWRDDRVFLLLAMVGFVLWLGIAIVVGARAAGAARGNGPQRWPGGQPLRAETVPMLTVNSKGISDQYLPTASCTYDHAAFAASSGPRKLMTSGATTNR
ncbi:MAG: type VI secretion system protein [Myxococcota bacterium]